MINYNYFIFYSKHQSTNDAPAVKIADVGISLGISGTEIVREASDAILLDDNLYSFTRALLWGRNIYESIRKLIQFQLTVIFVAIFICLIGACLINQTPINCIQLLWVSIIMDQFAQRALLNEPPNRDLMYQRPQNIDDSIVTPMITKFIRKQHPFLQYFQRLRNIVGQSIYQICVLTIVLLKFPEWFDIQNDDNYDDINVKQYWHLTMFFQSFVMMQIFNLINSKCISNQSNIICDLFKNMQLLMVMGLTFLIQLFIVCFGGKFFGVTPLDYNEHLICIFIGFGGLIVGSLLRLLPNFKCFNQILGRRDYSRLREDY